MKNLDIDSLFLKFGDFQRKGHMEKELDPRQITRIENSNSLYLTFDMCPSHKLDIDVINWLIDNKIRATFFVNVTWLKENKNEDLSFLNNKLFTIGGHGFHHVDNLKQSNLQQSIDIDICYEYLTQTLKHKIKWYRVPYGHPTETTFKQLDKFGLKCASWSGPVLDREVKSIAEKNEKEYLTFFNLSLRPGDLLILHANGTGKETIEILKELKLIADKRGYNFDKLPNV
jgi:peptidoglycan/xylan/chitin deacetylase (PgdA/CDA1 family)